METSEEHLVRIVDDYASDLQQLQDGTWKMDESIAADMDDDPDPLDAWMYASSVLDVEIVTRSSFGRPDSERVTDVEMLMAFGGPTVRIAFHENDDATVRGWWGTDVATRHVYVPSLSVVDRFSDLWEGTR